MTFTNNTDKLTKFAKEFADLYPKQDSAYQGKIRSREASSTSKSYSNEEIINIIERGSSNDKAILSRYFFDNNTIYQNLLVHLASLLMYSWLLIPSPPAGKKLSDKKIEKVYLTASKFCSDFGFKSRCTHFALEVLISGGYYGMKIEQSDKIIIQDLPFEYCRTRWRDEDNLDVVEFNLQFFDKIRDVELREQILKSYPKIVQKAYKSYISGKIDSWLFLPSGMGIYFNLIRERPFLLGMIPDLLGLDEYKEIDKERNWQMLSKILVSEIGLKKNDEFVLEPAEAKVYQKAKATMLQDVKNLDTLTTYAETKMLSTESEGNGKTTVPEALDIVYETSGITKEYFKPTAKQGLELAVENELSLMMILADRMSNYFTHMLNMKYGGKAVFFNFIFLPISHYNYKAYGDNATRLATLGYSFLTPFLTTGLNQDNLINLKSLENGVLNLQSELIPLQSSHTMSGKTGKTTTGEQNIPKESDGEKTIETPETPETQKVEI